MRRRATSKRMDAEGGMEGAERWLIEDGRREAKGQGKMEGVKGLKRILR